MQRLDERKKKQPVKSAPVEPLEPVSTTVANDSTRCIFFASDTPLLIETTPSAAIEALNENDSTNIGYVEDSLPLAQEIENEYVPETQPNAVEQSKIVRPLSPDLFDDLFDPMDDDRSAIEVVEDVIPPYTPLLPEDADSLDCAILNYTPECFKALQKPDTTPLPLPFRRPKDVTGKNKSSANKRKPYASVLKDLLAANKHPENDKPQSKLDTYWPKRKGTATVKPVPVCKPSTSTAIDIDNDVDKYWLDKMTNKRFTTKCSTNNETHILRDDEHFTVIKTVITQTVITTIRKC